MTFVRVTVRARRPRCGTRVGCSARGPRCPAPGALRNELGPPATQGSATGGPARGLGAADRDTVGSLGSPLCCGPSLQQAVRGPSSPGGPTSEEAPCARPQLPAAGPGPGSRAPARAFPLRSVRLSRGLEVQLPAARTLEPTRPASHSVLPGAAAPALRVCSAWPVRSALAPPLRPTGAALPGPRATSAPGARVRPAVAVACRPQARPVCVLCSPSLFSRRALPF